MLKQRVAQKIGNGQDARVTAVSALLYSTLLSMGFEGQGNLVRKVTGHMMNGQGSILSRDVDLFTSLQYPASWGVTHPRKQRVFPREARH
jgi:hypothetical protein